MARTEQALPNAVSLNQKWACLNGTNRGQALLHACSRNGSTVSLLQWQPTRFSNEPSLIRTFYDLPLFTTLTTTAKMICTADRIERILYAWKHEDMSWNPSTVEYLKLNRKSLLEWQESEPATKADNDWPRRRASHPIVSLLQGQITIDLVAELVIRKNKPYRMR